MAGCMEVGKKLPGIPEGFFQDGTNLSEFQKRVGTRKWIGGNFVEFPWVPNSRFLWGKGLPGLGTRLDWKLEVFDLFWFNF